MSEGRLASSPPEVGRWRPLGWGAPSWRGGSSPKEMTTMVATVIRRRWFPTSGGGEVGWVLLPLS